MSKRRKNLHSCLTSREKIIKTKFYFIMNLSEMNGNKPSLTETESGLPLNLKEFVIHNILMAIKCDSQEVIDAIYCDADA
jgi:hypothetical protein